jgi:hypothetical protein
MISRRAYITLSTFEMSLPSDTKLLGSSDLA